MTSFPFLQTMRARLTLWNVFVLALVLLALGGILRVSLERNLKASVDSDLAVRATRHTDWWANVPQASHEHRFPRIPPGNTSASLPRTGETQMSQSLTDVGQRVPVLRRVFELKETSAKMLPEVAGTEGRRTPVVERVFDLKGKQSWPFQEKAAPWNPDAFALAVQGIPVYSTVSVGDEQIRVFSVPLRRKSGSMAGVAQVAYSLGEVERVLANLDTSLLTLIPVALAAAAIGGLFLTGRMLRPVREVTCAAGRISAEDLSQRLEITGQDEFSELAMTFNAMLQRLELSFDQQRRFTADASHELRTPLTTIKANTSLALSQGELSAEALKVMQSIDKAAGVMNRVVQDLLLLARSDTGQLEIPLRPVSLGDVLETAVICSQPPEREAIRNLAQDIPVLVRGDTGHLTRLFVNLLDNAVRYTPAGGHITVFARQEKGAVVVVIEDTGIGISPKHLPFVCDRFYRVDEARTRAQGGTGLGLAICQSIVRAHGGQLHIASEPGQGTSVQVILSTA